MTEMNEFATLEELLPVALRQEAPSAAFMSQLRSKLQKQAPAERLIKARQDRLRLAWALGILLLALSAAVLGLGPRKVWAQLGRWFGFMPEYGFISSSEPLAIGQTYYQDSDSGRVTLVSGYADAQQTLIHLKFDQEAKAPTRVWLEDGSNLVLKLSAWAFSPNQKGSRGLELRFAALTGGSSGWTLRSDAGWNLPLYWQPAASSQMLQPNLLVSPAVPAVPTAVGPDLSTCIAREELRLCLSAVSVAGDQISLLLESPLEDQGLLNAYLFEQFVDPQEPALRPGLLDAQGKSITLNASGRSERDGFSTYTLSGTLVEGFQADGPLALNLPAVQYRLPLQAELSIQIPAGLQEGASFSLDQRLDLGLGQLRFTSAQLHGSRLFIHSEPFQMPEGTAFIGIELSKPERLDDLYGSGSELTPEGTRARIMLELDQASGRLSGEVKFPVVGAYFLWTNPAEIHFKLADLPAPAPAAEPSPAASLPIDEGRYPAALALTWHADAINAGSLIYQVQGSQVTSLYVASVEEGFKIRPWLEIPGQVASLKVIPDLQGIAFILGVNDENPDWVFRQTSLDALYFAPFGQDAQRLISLPTYAVEAAWRLDGGELAVLVREEGPGHSYTSSVILIPIEEGAAREIPLGNYWADWIAWSNAGDKLAFRRVSDGSEGSRADILVLEPAQNQPEPRSLTQAVDSALYIGGPLIWLGDDHALIALCEESSLCQADLNDNSAQVITTGLDLGMIRSTLVAQRWFPRFTHSRQDAETSLMVYDLLHRSEKALFTIGTGDTTKSQVGIMDLASSRWGERLAVYTSARGLEVFELSTGRRWQLTLPENAPSPWNRGSLIWAD